MNRCLFSMICVSAGSKSRLAKATGACGGSCSEQTRKIARRCGAQVKMYKTPQRRNTFGSCDVEKWHAAVARSTFASQNAKKLTFREHFWKHAGVARSTFASQNVQNTSASEPF